MSKKIFIHEAYTIVQPAETREMLTRISKRSRPLRPPGSLSDAVAYRTWLLDEVARLSPLDTTDAERHETEQWRRRIADATTEDLWAEYLEIAR